MSQEQKEQIQHIKKAIGNSIVIFTLGVVIFMIAGIIKGSFFYPDEPNKLQITKSPFQIIYSGDSNESVYEIINAIKDVPFQDYKFNTVSSFTVTGNRNTPIFVNPIKPIKSTDKNNTDEIILQGQK